MRSCGNCRLCCKAFPIPAFDKPRGIWCKHACDKGCAIHNQDRPPVCTDFRCVWLDGDLPEKMRPDKCGCIFWVIGQFEYSGEPVALYGIQQSHPAAWLGKKVKPILDVLVKEGFVFQIVKNHLDHATFHFLYSRAIYPLFDRAAVVAKVQSDMDLEKLKKAGVAPADQAAMTYEEALEYFRNGINTEGCPKRT